MKFVNCMFIIHKNGNMIRIQPVLKSNSTSFMFNNIFCKMNIKKSYPLGCSRGNGGTVLISSWKCNYSIYLDIQAISTLLCLHWLLMCWFLLCWMDGVKVAWDYRGMMVEDAQQCAKDRKEWTALVHM